MPISQTQFFRLNALLLALGAATLAAIVLVSLYLTAKTETHFSRVVAMREVRSSTADLMSLVQDAETGQRGFLLAREPEYLQPYTRAVQGLEAALSKVGTSLVNLPGMEANFEHLESVLKTKFAEMASTVALGETGRFDEAVAIIRRDTGRQLMDDARSDLALILNASERELAASIAEQTVAAYRLRLATIGGALAILIMAAAATWTIARYMKELREARREVEIANTALEERVRLRTDDLIKANEEIQRFAYIVTHDLRAPLVNIMGFTSELEAMFEPVQTYIAANEKDAPALREKAEEALNVEVPEAIGFIRSATRKMDRLINAILKISREGRRRIQPERLDLKEVLEAAAGAVHHQASADGAGITVESRAGSIVSDRLSLDQILGNLLDNAIKYKSQDRPIQVVVRTLRDSSGRVLIEVEDNGRGIAPSDHERVFELFRRSGKQNTDGEGIGLTHVRTLARNLGGDITVRSELDKGTVFTVVLPPDLNAVKRSTAQ